MVKGATNRGHRKVTPSAPKFVARRGNVAATPKRTSYSSMTRRQAGGSKAQEVSYDRTSRIKHEDPKSGRYERYTSQDKVSRKDFYKERGSGRVGVKDEFKRSSTVKVGDKRGYTEYYKEEKWRNVRFNNGSHNYGSNRQLPANDSRRSNNDNGTQSYGSDSDYSNHSDLQTHGYNSDATDVLSYSSDSDGSYDQDNQSCSNASDDNRSDEHKSYSNDDSDDYHSDGSQSYSNGSDDYHSDGGQSYSNGSDD